jgi:hypothetical protein
MKTRLQLILAAILGLLCTSVCFAQSPAAPVSPETQGFILQFLTDMAVKYPVVATIVGVMGTMRLWAKPVFSIVHQVIELTPTKWDDGYWAKGYDFLTKNPVGIAIAWGLDWIASIKIVPPGAQARPVPPGGN